MRLIIKLGHSLFKTPIDTHAVDEMADAIAEEQEKGHLIGVVVGGGSLARQYIDAATHLGMNWSGADQVGIDASRLNARLMIAALEDRAFPMPALSLEQMVSFFYLGKIVVMGGLTPGHSTDAVAALASEMIRTDLFIKTMDVGGIFDNDPKKYPGAKLIREVKYSQLREIVLASHSAEAGEYSPVDLTALEVMRRSQIPTVFIGSAPQQLRALIAGEPVGTRLIYD